MEGEWELANIAAVLKEEISRLARKEVRSQTQKLQKAAAQYRRDIAALKRYAATLKSHIASVARRVSSMATSDAAAPATKGFRFTAKGLRSHRSLLGFSAADYGRLAGVTGHTIYSWEKGASRPRQAQLAGLVSIKGLRKKEALARLEHIRGNAAGTRKKMR